MDNFKNPEIVKYFGKSLEIKNIRNGDLIPIGGSNMFSDRLDMKVVADFDNSGNESIRKKIYKEKGTQTKLSDIFNSKSKECAEIAVLAQRFLYIPRKRTLMKK